MSSLKNIVESKAFVVALLTVIGSIAANWGYNVPVDKIILLVTPLMIAIGALGWNDVSQAKLKLQHAHEARMFLAAQPGDDGAAMRMKIRQAGFARLGVMAMIASLGLALATGGACKEAQPIATNTIKCLEAEATTVSNGLSVIQLVSTIYGTIQKEGFVAAMVDLAKTYGPDVVACVVDSYPVAAPTPGSTGVSVAYENKQQALQALAPGKKLDHGKAK